MQIGYYPDPPSRRMAYDADGTRVLAVSTNLAAVTELTEGQKIAMNDEGGSRVQVHDHNYLTFIFPEQRNVTHYYAASGKGYHYAGISSSVVQWSNDTTNGQDGNWFTIAPSWVHNSNNGNGASGPITTAGFPDMRTHLDTMPASGVRAIRFRSSTSHDYVSENYIYTFHIYGHKTAGVTPHRLDFAYANGSELAQDFDFGDVPRNTEKIWSPSGTFNIGSPLYLRNRSPSKIAQDVYLTVQTLTGSMDSDITLSKDNSSYTTQLTWTEIQPLANVGPIYVKHTTSVDEQLGLRTCRLRLAVGSWF